MTLALDGTLRPQVDEVLSTLKDFQRDTVDYVFRRLYLDPDRVSRFLIADEVGLGKTLVARGVIAKAVDHLWETIDRIDVLYICSNQEIARQNIDRLNITADRKFQLASRATLLPVTLQQLKGNKLNFVSFTPGTSFQLHSSSGLAKERWVLFRLLMEHWGLHEPTCRNVLRAGVRKGNFKKLIAGYDHKEQIDRDLAEAFYGELDRRPDLRETYRRLAEEIGYRRKHIPPEARRERDVWIGKMRRLLARSSLAALEPDIVILDEFQRFKYLLEQDSPVSLLAREVFDFPDVKVLMLSATPYKMYSLAWEREEDHYQDFYRTVSFLLQENEDALADLEGGVQAFREAYIQLGVGGAPGLKRAKVRIEGVLRKIMVRTERLAASQDRNGMLREEHVGQNDVRARDFISFSRLDRIARHMDSGDQVEFWKSTAYPLNLMEGYKIKRQLKSMLEGEERSSLEPLLKAAEGHLLKWKDVQAYRELDPENARLRSLFQMSLDTGNWKLLWMPPALPYYRSGRAFADVKETGYTKSLIFSSWRVVPKAIAVLTSYEAERRTVQRGKKDFRYDELTRSRGPLLNFARSKDRLAGMPIFCLAYPSWTLATEVDPFRIAQSIANGRTPSKTAVFRRAREIVRPLLEDALANWPVEESGRTDDRWYWASLAILDWHHHRPLLEAWFATSAKSMQWQHMLEGEDEGGEERETRFVEHVRAFQGFLRGRIKLGKRPRDLLDTVTRIALAGPGTSTLRAMLRVCRARGHPG